MQALADVVRCHWAVSVGLVRCKLCIPDIIFVMSPAAAVPASRMLIRMYLTVTSSDGFERNRVCKKSRNHRGFKRRVVSSENEMHQDEARAIEAHLGEILDDLFTKAPLVTKRPSRSK